MPNDKKKKERKKHKATTQNSTSKSHKISWRRILEVAIGIVFALIIGVGVYAGVVIAKAPKIDTENIMEILSESTVIYDENGNEIDTIYTDTDRSNIKYEDLPPDLVNAFVALEDKTFWKHHGFNFIRIVGAITEAVFTDNDIGGTSTITQQLSRNLFLRDSRFNRSINRKIVEAYYSVILEKELSKEEIIEAYLNTIDLGYHSSGVQAASQAYFSKDVKDLTLAQCAALAPLAQQPTTFALVEYVGNDEVTPESENIIKRTPNGTFIMNDASAKRRNTCLNLMKEQGYITAEECDAAKKESLKDILDPSYTTPTGEAAYFADYVIAQVIDDLMEQNKWDYETAWNKVYKGGLKIYSTLDSEAQNVIESEFEDSSNFPGVKAPTDGNGNIIRHGNIALYDYDNYFDSDGNFTLTADEFKKNEDGSLVLFDGKRLNFYNTEVNGKTDYSLEFKSLYLYENNQLHTISGGFINIPQEYKSRNDNDDIVISAEFINNNKDFFIFNDDGTLTIPKSSYSLNQKIIQPQAAMTIVENSTGHIKAMVGGRLTTGRMLHNRATSPRQPGSSIKPLGVYTPAIAQSAEEVAAGKKHQFTDFGIDTQGADLWGDYLTAGSIVVDEKTHIEGRDWPYNAVPGFSGPITMRRALQLSVNTCAVKILMQVGTQYSADLIKDFGITTLEDEDLNIASLALGGMTHGVTTLEMASAYSTFPNNGTRTDTTAYIKVEDGNGKEILTSKTAETHNVLDPGVAWIMTDMLKSVVSSGIGTPASISGVQSGGKTGTTDDECDIWFDGFTPTYSASLWIGSDQNLELTEMSRPAAALWGKIMNQISKAKNGSYKGMPGNVVYVGGEYYISGTQSGKVNLNDIQKEVLICKDTNYLATPECTHTEKKKFMIYGKDKDKLPKYYCHKHNSNPEKYPISPNEVLVVKPEPPKDPDSENPENPENPDVKPEPPIIPDPDKED